MPCMLCTPNKHFGIIRQKEGRVKRKKEGKKRGREERKEKSRQTRGEVNYRDHLFVT